MSIVLSFAAACAHAQREPADVPVAMVGMPGPLVTSAPATRAAPTGEAAGAPTQTAGVPTQTAGVPTQTRVIADAPRAHEYSGRRVDLDVKDADIHNVLRLLADVGHVNIVVADDVQGTVTIRIRNVPWDQLLDVVVIAKGLVAERDGNVITVTRAR
jgi:type IV pilus assembly protein PilQ